MEELNYDVAREFIKRGKRIEPKYHPPSWYAQRHYTNTIHIGEYILWCEYDCWSHVTSVHISIPHGKIPFEIANAIYEKFKDEKYEIDERPIFKYNKGKSLNPSLVIVTDDEIIKARNAIRRIIFENKRIAYFFPEEIAKRVACPLYQGDPTGYDMCADTFDRHLFINNMQKFEKRNNLDVDSIELYTMEELEFTMGLIRSAENPKTP